MHFEVEQKHRVDDAAALESRLAELGAAWGAPIAQSDEYFAHPARDFAQTDEALRIRTVGDASDVTYKAPKLDATTKTRRELELPLVDGGKFAELLGALGFESVATVRKTRRPFTICRNGRKVDGAWDEVEMVGTFVELELTTDESGLSGAQRVISGLAAELGLSASERRSYLELQLSAVTQ